MLINLEPPDVVKREASSDGGDYHEESAHGLGIDCAPKSTSDDHQGAGVGN
jgi:hypothetical protein